MLVSYQPHRITRKNITDFGALCWGCGMGLADVETRFGGTKPQIANLIYGTGVPSPDQWDTLALLWARTVWGDARPTDPVGGIRISKAVGTLRHHSPLILDVNYAR